MLVDHAEVMRIVCNLQNLIPASSCWFPALLHHSLSHTEKISTVINSYGYQFQLQ